MCLPSAAAVDSSIVRSTSHGDQLLSYLLHLYRRQKLCDVVVFCDGTFVAAAHRVVLAAFSSFFELALANVDGLPDVKLDVDSGITGVRHELVKTLLDWMYTSRVPAATSGLGEAARALGCISLGRLMQVHRMQRDEGENDSGEGAKEQSLGERSDSAHSERLVENIRRFYVENRFCDVTIHCQSVPLLNCHRIILAAYSDHFRTLLAQSACLAFVRLDVDSVTNEVNSLDLRTMVDFIYSGTVRVSSRRMRGLLSAARHLSCGKLIETLTAAAGDENDSDPRPSTPLHHENSGEVSNTADDVPELVCEQGSSRASKCTGTDGPPTLERQGPAGLSQPKNTDHDGGDAVDSQIGSHVSAYEGDLYHDVAAGAVAAVECVVADSAPAHRLPELRDGLQPLFANDDREAYCPPLPPDRNQQWSTLPDKAATSTAPSAVDQSNLARDDYVDIYDEFVTGPGPRRNKRSDEPPARPRRSDAIVVEDGLAGYVQAYTPNPTGVSPPSNSFSPSNSPGPAVSTAQDQVFVSRYTPQPHKRPKRLCLDAYGYGLPEFSAKKRMAVPILVGGQREMMEKPFKCPYCAHRTKEKAAIDKHIRCMHTLEAPYRCSHCGQQFKVQSNLVRHVRSHTGVKPYVCKKCGAMYADKKNMDAHVFRQHLRMKQLECTAANCGAKFWRQDRYDLHVHHAHGGPAATAQTVAQNLNVDAASHVEV